MITNIVPQIKNTSPRLYRRDYEYVTKNILFLQKKEKIVLQLILTILNKGILLCLISQ